MNSYDPRMVAAAALYKKIEAMTKAATSATAVEALAHAYSMVVEHAPRFEVTAEGKAEKSNRSGM